MLIRHLSRKLTGILFLSFVAILSVLQLKRLVHNDHEAVTQIRSSNTSLSGHGLSSNVNQIPLDNLLPPSIQQDEDKTETGPFFKAIISSKDDDESNNREMKPRQFDYREIFSLTTPDRKFIPIYLAGYPGYNANLIPHPTKTDFWIVVVQHEEAGKLKASEQLACTAGFLNGALICTDTPAVMPITSEAVGNCDGDLTYVRLVWGPRDARLFYGPEAPYIIYGSQSQYICFGLWLQDARGLLDEFAIHRYMQAPLFGNAVEMRRLSDYQLVEKNYFLFWDAEGRVYAHYNLWPVRSFAQLNFDGTGLSDLASASAYSDQVCMAKFLPPVWKDFESIHQATNSLSITLCRRSDPTCIPNDSNTFIMHIFHHKSFYAFHGVYEPFVILFQRSPPFAIHAISQRPLWIHGRNNLTAASDATKYRSDPGAMPEDHTEMFYITSMSWKAHTQKYHGYIDDPLFLAFGIEDARPGAIDTLAGDIVQDLAFC